MTGCVLPNSLRSLAFVCLQVGQTGVRSADQVVVT